MCLGETMMLTHTRSSWEKIQIDQQPPVEKNSTKRSTTSSWEKLLKEISNLQLPVALHIFRLTSDGIIRNWSRLPQTYDTTLQYRPHKRAAGCILRILTPLIQSFQYLVLGSALFKATPNCFIPRRTRERTFEWPTCLHPRPDFTCQAHQPSQTLR